MPKPESLAWPTEGFELRGEFLMSNAQRSCHGRRVGDFVDTWVTKSIHSWCRSFFSLGFCYRELNTLTRVLRPPETHRCRRHKTCREATVGLSPYQRSPR